MVESKKALITGITGQDGSYLAEFLLSKGYEVHGLIRSSSTSNTSRIQHILNRIVIHHGDLSDSDTIAPVMSSVKPDEIYNLGAQSHGGLSFEMPEYTGNVTGLGTTRILEAMRKHNSSARFYQASTSEMFGNAPPPQSENTPLHPTSPYACAKAYSYWMVKNYRKGYGMFATNGILFNHESPRRGETFVTRKITLALANIMARNQNYLELGNLSTKIDWGFAPEYVQGMWQILQMTDPDDYVLGTGKTHSVQTFVDTAFKYTGLEKKLHMKYAKYGARPIDEKILKAGTLRANIAFDWSPEIGMDDLVKIMIDADFRKLGLTPKGEGDKIIKKVFKNKWWKGD
jgi:GDPmannose 4,6-dehydratase